jgi:hypothetical protein
MAGGKVALRADGALHPQGSGFSIACDASHSANDADGGIVIANDGAQWEGHFGHAG